MREKIFPKSLQATLLFLGGMVIAGCGTSAAAETPHTNSVKAGDCTRGIEAPIYNARITKEDCHPRILRLTFGVSQPRHAAPYRNIDGLTQFVRIHCGISKTSGGLSINNEGAYKIVWVDDSDCFSKINAMAEALVSSGE